MLLAYTTAKLDPTTQKKTYELQLFAQPDPPRAKGKHFYLIYLSSYPAVEVTVNAEARNVQALHLFPIDDIARGEIKIEQGGKTVLEFTANQHGNFHVVLFDKSDGTIGGMLLPDYG